MSVSGWLTRRRAGKRLRDGLSCLTDGEVATVVGVVFPAGEILIAPVTGKNCVAYEARVSTASQNLTVEPVRAIIPFDLQTSSGMVRIDAEHAELLIEYRPLIPRNLDRERAFVSRLGYEIDMRSVTCEEICVEVGTMVAVHGVVQLEVAPQSQEAGYRHAGTRIRISAHPEHALTIGAPR